VASKINAEIRAALDSRDRLAQKLAALEKLPSALLREAFSGRL
jgi:hypothetical protein